MTLELVAGPTQNKMPILSEALLASVSANTRRMYQSAWAGFNVWCDDQGLAAMPVTDSILAAYLVDLGNEGKTVATLKLHKAAIVKAHDLAGHPKPNGPVLRAVVAGLERMYGRRQTQAKGLGDTELDAIKATAKHPRIASNGRMETPKGAKRRGNVDIALASTMRDGLLRVSEAAAVTWADVTEEPDGSGRLLIRRSKTDKTGTGQTVYLSKPTMRTLAVIRPKAVDTDSRIFGLANPNSVGNRIKAMTKVAGLGDGFSGHSARVGMAQDLSAAGTELGQLMNAGRWKTAEMPARYTENQALERGAVAGYYRGR